MKYCSHCGAAVALLIPEGDTVPRHVCTICTTIHYLNPKLVVGCIAEWDHRILLCRRAIEPRRGFWTLPAGFMENGETTAEASARETREEALATVESQQLFALINIPHIHQVHLFYRGNLHAGHFAAGAESLECALFAEDEIPWPKLAFRSVTLALEAYFHDRKLGRWSVHTADLFPSHETPAN